VIVVRPADDTGPRPLPASPDLDSIRVAFLAHVLQTVRTPALWGSSSWSASLIGARMRAAVEGIDQGRSLRKAMSSTETVALVPATAFGRMLSRKEAAKLIRQLERGIPKRSAAASVRRAVKRMWAEGKAPGPLTNDAPEHLQKVSRQDGWGAALPSAESTGAALLGSFHVSYSARNAAALPSSSDSART